MANAIYPKWKETVMQGGDIAITWNASGILAL